MLQASPSVAEVLQLSSKVEPHHVYTFKADRHSSHAAILRLTGSGQDRRLLDIGTADGFLAQQLAEQGRQFTGIEREPALASVARQHCCDLVVADLNEGVPSLDGLFDAMVFRDILERPVSPEAVFRLLTRFFGA